jgi:hypothetical protein
MMSRTILARLAAIFVCVTSAASHGAEITPFAAVMAGGGFEDEATGTDLEIRPSAAAGFILGFPWQENSQLEFYVSHQPTEVRPESGPGASFDLNMNYYHVGGTVVMEPQGKFQPYFVATMGATHFDPGDSLSSEVRFSFSGGLGGRYPLSPNLALRLEGRFFATLVESDSQIFCSLPGACNIRVQGSTLIQWQGLLGLSYRF